jgi:hypothetical protein
MIILLFVILVLGFLHILSKINYNDKDLEHMTDESVQNLSSLAAMYNTGQLTVANLKATRDANVSGKLNVDSGATIKSDINVGEIVNAKRGYFKGGSAGGGNGTHFPWAGDEQNYIRGHTNHDGDLRINGQLAVGGRNILAELDDLKNNVLRRDKGYVIQSGRGGYLVDAGGWSDNFNGTWEMMYFRPSGSCRNDVGKPLVPFGSNGNNTKNQTYPCNA